MVKMFPSKSMVEYMSEMNRLFSKAEDDEPPTPFHFNPYQSPYQTAMVNKSSSSADSTSPESYPDLFRSGDLTPQRPQDVRSTDSTFTLHRQRAIVGRKILGNTQQMQTVSPAERMDMDFNFWQHEHEQEPLPETPPESSIQPKNFLYGLLQAENRQLEYKTPVKRNSNVFPDFSPNLPNRSQTMPIRSPTLPIRSPTLPIRSPNLPNRSPLERNMFNASPIPTQVSVRSQMSNQSLAMSLLSPTWSNSSQSSLLQRRQSSLSNYSEPMLPSYPIRATDEILPTKMCTFCRKNGETPVVYMTHSVKEKVGNRNVVTCPILRSHVCATCGATGDDAHTITYCPVLRSTNNGKPLQSTTITLKNTRIKSNGRRRY